MGSIMVEMYAHIVPYGWVTVNVVGRIEQHAAYMVCSNLRHPLEFCDLIPETILEEQRAVIA